MDLRGRVVVVTGGASGIGRALCRRFAAESAAAVVVADVDGSGARATAEAITSAGGTAMAVPTDVTSEQQIAALVRTTEEAYGPVDLFASNAGIATGMGVEAPDETWQRIWQVNVMAHVYAARAVLPSMLARGEGYLLNTASAAGLLTNLGDAPYSATKHAAVALAEWLSITHGAAGVRVSVICPQGVRTPMLLGGLDAGETAGAAVVAAGGLIEPEEVADAAVEGVRAERFLILPHPEVADFVRRRADDRERWLAGMRKLQARLDAARQP